MNIAHIVEATATGTLSMVVTASNIQVGDGHQVHVIYSLRDETPDNIKCLFDDRVKLHCLEMGAKSFPFSVLRLNFLLNDIQADIIHCHSSFAGFVGRFASLSNQVPIFYSPHCIAFMRKDIGWFKRQMFRIFELIANIRSSTYIACSKSEKLAIERELPFIKVKLLENAVDLSEYQCVYNDNNSIVQRIVTVGGIRAQKGPEEFAEIARNCKKEGYEFVWIGDGNIQSRLILESAGVTIKGWMPKKDVIKYLQQADLYISTARWEGMPVSIIEAIAAELPVIARECAGNVDVISNNINGCLFSTTVDAIKLVKEWQYNPEQLIQQSKNAYQEVFERFSVKRFSRELSTIYHTK